MDDICMKYNEDEKKIVMVRDNFWRMWHKYRNADERFECIWAEGVVRRPSVVISYHIFDFFSETAERNSMKLDKKKDLDFLYQVCIIQSDRKNKVATHASDWLRHFRLLLWNRWMEFNKSS